MCRELLRVEISICEKRLVNRENVFFSFGAGISVGGVSIDVESVRGDWTAESGDSEC